LLIVQQQQLQQKQQQQQVVNTGMQVQVHNSIKAAAAAVETKLATAVAL
jgi:hypothetical protein